MIFSLANWRIIRFFQKIQKIHVILEELILGCVMDRVEVLKLVELADNSIAQKTGEPLSDVQKNILRQALVGEKLKDIQVAGYSSNTIQREIAPKLWKLLSDVTEKKVSIKTVRLVLEELRERDAEAKQPHAQPLPVTQGGENKRGERENPMPDARRSIPNLELPGGSLDLASEFYIDRPSIEERAYEEIAKPGSLIRIKAPKQMGKTSLMTRLLQQAERLGYRSVALDFELADREVFWDLNQFLQWFCATVTDDLELPIQLDSRWSEFLGSKKNCTNYFEKYLLAEIATPLVLGLDAVDRIFPQEKVADDFFGLLRAWHEKSKQSDIWKNFRLVIVHGTEVYIPLSKDLSPFNVGLPIELPEFNASQVQDLARRHGLDLTETQVKQLMAMVGGHPHLVRVALYKMARENMSLDRILKEAPTDTGIYGEHLRSHLWHLERNPEFAECFKQVVATNKPVQIKSAIAYKLNSIGLVHLQGNQVTIRNDLYRQYFRDRFLGS
ncbi:AAA-like domain-containing protein [Aerosakkonema funiforme]|uniref:AAA-like domain-containing protein n=1 Tax=Aerosakkonema funiforme TaxID=1246630 RepID=UPI0035BC82E9